MWHEEPVSCTTACNISSAFTSKFLCVRLWECAFCSSQYDYSYASQPYYNAMWGRGSVRQADGRTELVLLQANGSTWNESKEASKP